MKRIGIAKRTEASRSVAFFMKLWSRSNTSRNSGSNNIRRSVIRRDNINNSKSNRKRNISNSNMSNNDRNISGGGIFATSLSIYTSVYLSICLIIIIIIIGYNTLITKFLRDVLRTRLR